MKVIFIKDLKGQGKTDEVKEVKDGYAQNFLIKKGYAVPFNDSNKKHLASKQEKTKQADESNTEEANKTKAKLEKEEFIFKVKVGEQDKVFGSITPKQITEELNKKGYKIDKKQLKTDGSISSLGVHIVEITLYKTIIAKIKVQVTK